MEYRKQNCSKKASTFRAEIEFQFLPKSARIKVPEESGWRFRGSLLYRIEHPKTLSSRLHVQDRKSRSIPTSLCTPSCHFSIFMDNMSSDPGFICRIWISDECIFPVLGLVNTRNTRIRRIEYLKEYQQQQLNSTKVTIWCD